MDWMPSELPRYRVLGIPFNPIDRSLCLEYLRGSLAGTGLRLVVTLGTEMVMAAQTDRDFAEVVEKAELVVPDGIGVVLAARLAGLQAPGRIAGVELLLEMLRQAPVDTRFFFYGGAPGVAEEAVARLQQQVSFEVAGCLDGYQQDEEFVLCTLEQARPQVLFVALGFPRQEAFIDRNRERLEAAGVRLGVGVGGSFDVYAGRVQRAPVLFQRLHLEWFYRFLLQPSRWRRLMSLPLFALKVLKGPKKAVEVCS